MEILIGLLLMITPVAIVLSLQALKDLKKAKRALDTTEVKLSEALATIEGYRATTALQISEVKAEIIKANLRR
jgi:hypothetical protein